MKISAFFLLNYTTYALLFLTQIVISRTYGLEVFGQYAIFLALMALVEAPIIAARSDSALLTLNRNKKDKSIIMQSCIKDFKNTGFFAPIIFIITFLQFDIIVATLAVFTVLSQSGYASSKNFFIVHDLRQQFTVIETLLAVFGIFLLLAVGFWNNSFHALVIFYCIFAGVKNLSLFIYLSYKRRISITANENTKRNDYQPTSLAILLRNLTLNGVSNLDILILSTTLELEQVGMYKITKSCAAIIFRFIAPFWRWKLYKINWDLNNKAVQNYSISQLQGGLLAFTLLLVTLPFSDLIIKFASDYIFAVFFDLTLIPTQIVFLNSFLILWFLSWYKIDMLYRINKILTLSIPLIYCLFLFGYSVSFVVDFEAWIFNYLIWNIIFVFSVSFYLLGIRRNDGFT